MPKFSATIRHHSIARARVVGFDVPSLAVAKQYASRAFGNEQRGYEIVIFDEEADDPTTVLAFKTIGQHRWTNCED